MKSNIKKNESKLKQNYIMAEIEIKDEDINEEIRIINSYDNMKKNYGWDDDDKYYIKREYEDTENEIKKIIVIKIDNEYLPSFTYFYKFKTSGIHIIQYSFKNNLSNANYLFSNCDHITKIDLSNFNSESLKSMVGMFSFCKALTYLNLSNFKIDKVKDFDNSKIFSQCNSLKKKNVITDNDRILKYV